MDKPKVFISYATEDQELVMQVVSAFESANCDVWLDKNKLKSGELSEAIITAILSSDWGIFLLTETSVTKPWVESEFKFFYNNKEKNRLFPVIIGISRDKIPGYFTGVKSQTLKSYLWDSAELATDIRELVSIIKADEIDGESYFFYDKAHLDLALTREYPSAFEKKMIDFLMKQKAAHESYFFSNLQNPTWFVWLKRLGWFDLKEDKIDTRESKVRYPRSNPHRAKFTYLELVAAALDQPEMADLREEFWDIFYQASKTKRKNDQVGQLKSYNAFAWYPAILTKAPAHLVPNLLIREAATVFLEAALITEWLAKLLDGPVDEERLAAIEYLIMKAFEINHKEGTISLGFNHEWLNNHTEIDRILDKLAPLSSTALIGFFTNQLSLISAIKRGKGSHILPEIQGKHYEVDVVLDKFDSGKATLSLVNEISWTERVEKAKNSPWLQDRNNEYPFSSDQKEPIGEFHFQFQSHMDLVNVLLDNLSKRNLLLKTDPNIESELKSYTYRLFEDPYLRSFGETSLRKKRENWHYSENAEDVPLIWLLGLIERMAASRPDIARPLIIQYLGDAFPYRVLKRIALEVINTHWEAYKDLFWAWVEMPQDPSPFASWSFRKELAYLVQDRIAAFNSMEKDSYLRLLLNPSIDEHTRMKWLSPAKGVPILGPVYYELKERHGGKDMELDPEGPQVRITSGAVRPLSPEELLQKPIGELAAFLHDFRGAQMWRPAEIPGLADSLLNAIKVNPEWILPVLPTLTEVYYVYGRAIAEGFHHAAKSNATVPWEQVIRFFADYIGQDEFWEDTFTISENAGTGNHGEALYFIIELIGQLSKKPVRDQVAPYIQELIGLLKTLFTRLDFPPVEKSEDPVMQAINTRGGRFLQALLDVSLFKAALDFPDLKESQIRWDRELQNIWEEKISQGYIPAVTLSGLYLNELYWLNSDWTEEKITDFQSVNKDIWLPFMVGHLHSDRIYEGIFARMKPHYQRFYEEIMPELRSIKKNKGYNNPRELFIRHLTIAYLQGWELLGEDNLWTTVVKDGIASEVRWTTFIFLEQTLPGAWSAEDEDFNGLINRRIIRFWEYYYNYFQNTKEELTLSDKQILGILGLLMARLPNLEEPYFSWCKYSIAHMEEDNYHNDYLKGLLQLKERLDSEEIRLPLARIFRELVQRQLPDYPKNAVPDLLEYLIETNDPGIKMVVREICAEYANHGLAEMVEKIALKL